MTEISPSQLKHLKEDLEDILDSEKDIITTIEEMQKNFHNDGVIHGLIATLNEININLGEKYYYYFFDCIDIYWKPCTKVYVERGENDGHNRGSGIDCKNKDIVEEYKKRIKSLQSCKKAKKTKTNKKY